MVSLPGALRLIGRHGPRWLYAGGNRSDRWRDPDAVIGALGLRSGDRVADIGAGYGTFTGRLARAVGPGGVVYADLDLLERLARRARDASLDNIHTVAARGAGLDLPEPVDLLFGAAVFHHLPEQAAYFTDARALLRPGGRVAILESRREGLLRRWFPHGTAPAEVRATMRAAGFVPLGELDLVRGHLFAIFGLRA